MLKYVVLRVRMKISFEAFRRYVTISELFLTTILKSCVKIIKTKSVKNFVTYPPSTIDKFSKSVRRGMPSMFSS